MAGDPQITVVIPTYQRARTVARAVRSALDQRAVRAQVVVVDDGSIDDTAEVLSELEHSGLVVHHQANRGRGAARNQGAALGAAPLLTFLDSDDELLPGALAHMVGLFEAPQVGLVRTGALVETRSPEDSTAGMERSPGAARVRLPAGVDPRRPFRQGVALVGTYAVQSDVFARVGGFDPAFGFAENTELLVRLALDARRAGWRGRSSAVITVLMHAEAVAGRSARYGSAQRVAAEVLLDRYRHELRREPGLRSDYWAIVGTDARRAGDGATATGSFVRSWLARPHSPMAAARLLASLAPQITQRVPGVPWATDNGPSASI